MDFQKHKPSEHLAHIADCYWTLKGKTDIYSARSYPDGCTTFIVNLGDLIHLDFDGNKFQQNAFTIGIYGNVTKFFQFEVGGNVDLISINFKPGALYSLISMPLFELTNMFVDSRFTRIKNITELIDTLASDGETATRIQTLEQYLLKSANVDNSNRKLVRYSINHIMRAHGNISVESIIKEAGTTQRQLERKFKTYVGISPKKLAQILRFRHVQEFLKASPGTNLLSVAYDNGYFDHAHLTKDFKQLAGVTPSYFSQYLPYF